MKMKLLITGGAGFLGYHLSRGLSEHCEEIRLLDTASVDFREYPLNIRAMPGDIRDAGIVREAMKGSDAVIHAAAALPLATPETIREVNVDGARNVLASAFEQGIKRFVYISSTAVYGIPKKHPIEESDPVSGVGPYGESKIRAEALCEEYRKKGMCVSVLRPKTFIGSGRLGVFQILYDWIHDGKKIPVIGSGKNLYQLLEVRDLVKAVFLTLTQPVEKVNDTFNVGAEKFGAVRDDLAALFEFAGTRSRVLPTSAAGIKFFLRLFESMNLSPLYRWVYETADKDSFVSVEKIKKQLGWSSQFSNAEALIHSYQWYLEHLHEISGVGITHRSAWKQGILGIFKKLL